MSSQEKDPHQVEPTSSATEEKTLQSPHDRLVRQALQKHESVRRLVEGHLPRDISQHLKLETLAAADTSLIDRNLRRRFADQLFSIEVTDEFVQQCGLQTKYIHLLVLIDHKSTDEPSTLIQMLGYIIRLWEIALENKQPIVPIIPWIIYNGIRPWRAPSSLDQLIPVPDNWNRFVPRLELPILDVSRMDDAAMAGEPFLQVTFTLLKYGRDAELEFILPSLMRMIAPLISVRQAHDLLDTMRIYVMSVNPNLGEDKINALATEFWPVQPEPGSVAAKLMGEGEAKGIEKGKAKEKATTIRMLQGILGQPQSTDEHLSALSLDELQSLIESLQQLIVRRDK